MLVWYCYKIYIDRRLENYKNGILCKYTFQVEAQKEIGDLITKMKRAGDTVGLHIIDKELQ